MKRKPLVLLFIGMVFPKLIHGKTRNELLEQRNTPTEIPDRLKMNLVHPQDCYEQN